MDNVIAGIIGAMVGALASGLVAWFLYKRGRKHTQADQAMEILSNALSKVLNQALPDTIHSTDELNELRKTWGEALRLTDLRRSGVGVLSFHHDLNNCLTAYFCYLEYYLNGELKREELDDHRRQCREIVVSHLQEIWEQKWK